jgi:peptidylprolyl isomerase
MAAALALTGCSASSGSSDAGSPSPAASASGSSAPGEWTGESVPEVSGSYGDKPTLTFSEADPPATLQRKILHVGTGPVVQSGEMLAADYLGQVYGGKVFDNSYDRKAPSGFPIGTGRVIAGWDNSLVGLKAGTRVLLSVPPDQGYGDSGNSDAGITGTDTLVFVVDLIASSPADAAGDPKATTDEAPPEGITVKGDLGRPPSVEISGLAPKPQDAKVTVLAKGSGEPLPTGLAVLQYVAYDWSNVLQDSTWQSGGPAGVAISDSSQSQVFDTLRGVPIGSRALIVLPEGSGGGPYALVVDVVAHVPTAKESAAAG